MRQPMPARSRGIILLLCLLLPVAGQALDNLDPRTIRYDWLTAGEVSGSHVLKIRADGTRTADFEFNDRGRGPKIHEEISVGSDGALLSLQVSGHSHMGAPAAESFRVADGRAAWESTLERGEATAGSFYVAHDGNPLDDISAVRRPVAVFKGDRWYDPAKLYEAVGIRPFTR